MWCVADRRGVEGREPDVPCPCHLGAVRALLVASEELAGSCEGGDGSCVVQGRVE